MKLTSDVDHRTQPRYRRKRRWLLYIVLGIIGMFCGAAIGLPHWVSWAIVCSMNHGRSQGDLQNAAGNMPSVVDQQIRIPVGPPAASLSIWVIEPTDSGAMGPTSNRTVLVLHGIRSGKSSMVGPGLLLARNGFRAVLVDLRGHGASTGDWLTYGVVESCDLSQLLDALTERGLVTGKVGLYGASYGAATSLMLAGSDSRVAAVVAVAPFTSLHEIVVDYVRQQPLIDTLLTDQSLETAIVQAGRKAGFDPAAARPIDAIQHTQAQVLLIHGLDDQKIRPSHSESLHAAADDHSRLILVKGEGHDSIMLDRTGTISKETIAWFKQWLAP